MKDSKRSEMVVCHLAPLADARNLNVEDFNEMHSSSSSSRNLLKKNYFFSLTPSFSKLAFVPHLIKIQVLIKRTYDTKHFSKNSKNCILKF